MQFFKVKCLKKTKNRGRFFAAWWRKINCEIYIKGIKFNKFIKLPHKYTNIQTNIRNFLRSRLFICYVHKLSEHTFFVLFQNIELNWYCGFNRLGWMKKAEIYIFLNKKYNNSVNFDWIIPVVKNHAIILSVSFDIIGSIARFFLFVKCAGLSRLYHLRGFNREILAFARLFA